MIMDFFRQGSAAPGPQGAPEAKASAAGRVAAWHGGSRVVWGARDTGTLTRQGFAANPVGFRCVKMIAEAAASLPLVLQDAEQRYSEHPMLSLMRRPNPAQGRAELLEAASRHRPPARQDQRRYSARGHCYPDVSVQRRCAAGCLRAGPQRPARS